MKEALIITLFILSSAAFGSYRICQRGLKGSFNKNLPHSKTLLKNKLSFPESEGEWVTFELEKRVFPSLAKPRELVVVLGDGKELVNLLGDIELHIDDKFEGVIKGPHEVVGNSLSFSDEDKFFKGLMETERKISISMQVNNQKDKDISQLDKEFQICLGY